MATKLGNDYRLWVEGATAGTYAMILGQQDLKYSRKATTIDTSTKDNAPYATAAAGLFQISITLNGIAQFPDATGFSQVETNFKAQISTNFQIRKGGAGGVSPGDVVFACKMNILELSTDFGQNKPLSYVMGLDLSTAPTVDTLA